MSNIKRLIELQTVLLNADLHDDWILLEDVIRTQKQTLEVLREVEWNGNLPGVAHSCPVCNAEGFYEKPKHEDDCKLANLIEELKE